MLTDHSAAVIANLRFNLAENLAKASRGAVSTKQTDAALSGIDAKQKTNRVRVERLSWHHLPTAPASLEQFDLVVGSDLFYHAGAMGPLAETVQQSVAPGGTFLAVSPANDREGLAPFVAAMEAGGFRVATLPACAELVHALALSDDYTIFCCTHSSGGSTIPAWLPSRLVGAVASGTQSQVKKRFREV